MSLSTEAKVGSVTLMGLLLLGYMIVHLGGFTLRGNDDYPVTAKFSHVGGLREGNAVRYAGVDIGRVKSVEIVPEGVNVTLMIQLGAQIPYGSRFMINSDGLMGEKFINIAPPVTQQSANIRFLEHGAQVQGEVPQGLDTLIANADHVLGDIQKLVQSLNDILGDEKVKAALKDSAVNAKDITANLNRLSASLARMAETNEQDVQVMVSNLAGMSASLREVAGRVDKMVANVDNNGQTAADLKETIANIKATSQRVEKMAASLEGVVTDPETTRSIKETLKNAREASEKANKMLSKVSNIKTETSFEMLQNRSDSRYSTNADIKISTSPQDFAVIGATHIGDGSRANIQIGKTNGSVDTRAGIIEGKLGMGVDANITKQMKLSLDVYDPNDVRVKLRTQYQVAPDTYVVGQTEAVNKDADKNTYIGIKRTF